MKQKGSATPKSFGLLRTKGGFATILVLLAVVLVGGVGVGWYLSNTGVIPKFSSPATSEQPPALPTIPETGEDASREPNGSAETANWKTYSNKNVGYSFKYPSEAALKEENMITVKYAGPNQKEGTELYDGYIIQFSLLFELNSTELNSLLKYTEREANKSELIVPITETSLNNLHGYTYTAQGLGEYKHILLQKAPQTDKFVEIVIGPKENLDTRYQLAVDQILSTFKFD